MTKLFQDLSNQFNPGIAPAITPRFKTRFESEDAGDPGIVELDVEKKEEYKSKNIEPNTKLSRQKKNSSSTLTPELTNSVAKIETEPYNRAESPSIAEKTESIVPHYVNKIPNEQTQQLDKLLTSDLEQGIDIKRRKTQEVESIQQQQHVLKETETVTERTVESKQNIIDIQTERIENSDSAPQEFEGKTSTKVTDIPVNYTVNIGRIDVKSSVQPIPQKQAFRQNKTAPVKPSQVSTSNPSQSKLTAYLGWGK